MDSRLTNTSAVSEQDSPIIVVVQDSNPNKIYIKKDPNENLADESDDDSRSSHLHQAQVAYYENKEDVTDSELIWSHRRPTENDYNATEYFLQLRSSEKYRALFGDKKFGKYKLWSEIAEEMNNAGFYVGEGREAAERCRQKFSNLEKGFLNYMKLVKSGNRNKNPPQFYDLLYNLVDHEDKLYKQEQHSLIDAVRDSLQVELISTKDTTVTVASGPSRSTENLHTDFSNTPNSSDHVKVKKLKQKDEIITLLTKQHSEMMKLQKDYLEKLDRHLTTQNEQREKLINSFIEILNEPPCKCKRKRRSSSSDSDQNI